MRGREGDGEQSQAGGCVDVGEGKSESRTSITRISRRQMSEPGADSDGK